MTFNDTSTLDGLIQECERITQLGVAGISGNANLLKAFTAHMNQGLDRYSYLSLMADGRWQIDDTNATDLPIGTTDLVSGQRDYTFAGDVLVVNKVLAKDPAGNWGELLPVDLVQTQDNVFARNTWELPSGDVGTPKTYDKLANSIFLDPVPNYGSTGGLKCVFSRNFTKFASTDTTAVPGIPSIFHPYLPLYASYPFLRDNKKSNAQSVQVDILRMEEAIQEFYGKRSKDEPNRITIKPRSPR